MAGNQGENRNLEERLAEAKVYQKKRNWLTLADLLLSCLLLTGMIVFHFQKTLMDLAAAGHGRYLELFLFFLYFTLFFFVFRFPLTFYESYLLEKHHHLSNHTLASWFLDTAKKEILSFVLSAVMIGLLFWLIWADPRNWWWRVWLAYAFVSYVIGKLFPVFIIPLFYKYQPLPEGELRSGIINLASRFGMQVDNIYSLNLSRTTKKANAAFCGFGKTKRIILSDTLLNQFTNHEIEMVLAHELGHFKHKDIWKQLAFGMAFSFVGFWLSFEIVNRLVANFGYQGVGDFYYFPHLCLMFYLFGLVLSPLGNIFSRYVEKQADLFALKALGNKDVFISTMQKLAEINLADPNPHPVIEFLLYDHPSIQKRIQLAR